MGFFLAAAKKNSSHSGCENDSNFRSIFVCLESDCRFRLQIQIADSDCRFRLQIQIAESGIANQSLCNWRKTCY